MSGSKPTEGASVARLAENLAGYGKLETFRRLFKQLSRGKNYCLHEWFKLTGCLSGRWDDGSFPDRIPKRDRQDKFLMNSGTLLAFWESSCWYRVDSGDDMGRLVAKLMQFNTAADWLAGWGGTCDGGLLSRK